MTTHSTLSFSMALTVLTPLVAFAGAAPQPQKPAATSFAITSTQLSSAKNQKPGKSQKPAATSFAITSAQLSSAKDQKPGKLVEFELKDNVNGISIGRDSVTIQKPGSYLLMAAPQITATQNGGCLDLWLILNDKDIPNSGIRSCQTTAGNTDVLMSQTIIKLKQGDRIQVMTTGKGAILDAVQPEKGPLIPSIIFTVLGLN